MTTLGNLFNMEPEQKQVELVPYVTFEKDPNGKGYKEGQNKIVRFLEEFDAWHLEVVHYVNDGPTKGSYKCGKKPIKKLIDGKETWLFVGDCQLCNEQKAEQELALKEGRQPNRSKKRNYIVHAKVEEKVGDEDNPTYELKGLRLKVGDLFYPTAKGSFGDISKLAKTYKGSVVGRWVAVDEKGGIVNFDPVTKEDQKRTKGQELPDLSGRFVTQTAQDYVQKLGGLEKANAEAAPYDNGEGLLDDNTAPFNF